MERLDAHKTGGLVKLAGLLPDAPSQLPALEGFLADADGELRRRTYTRGTSTIERLE